jgi:hypothetical protein
MGLSGKIHVMAAVLLRKEHPVASEQETGRIPEGGCFGEENIPSPLPEI